MAITVTKVAEDFDTSNATGYADTESTTPTANRALLWATFAHAAATPAVPSSMVAYGVTWTQLATLAVGTTARLTVYEGYSGSSPTASTATATMAAACVGNSFVILEFADADATDFTVQQPTNSGTGTTATITFGALADGTNNVEVMFTGTLVNAAITPDATATWTEQADSGHNSPTARLHAQTRTGTDLTATTTWTGSAAWGAVGVEVKMAPPATVVTPATVAVVATVDSPVLLGAAVIVAEVVTVVVGIDTPTIDDGSGADPLLNQGSGTAARNGTFDHTIPFGFTSATGSLLVFVVSGGVTHTESGSGGWTERHEPTGDSGLSLFTKTSVGDSSITLTHNGSDYPVHWFVQEWVTGSAWHSGVDESADDSTFPALGSLTGTLQLGAAWCSSPAGAGSGSSTWTAGSEGWTEQADLFTARGGSGPTDGTYLTVATATDFTGSSTTPAGTFPRTAPYANSAQKIVWAIDAGTAAAGTTVTPAAVAVTVGIDTPTVSGAATVTPAEVAVTTTVPQATVLGAALVVPAEVVVVVAVPTTTILGGALVAPATVTLVATLDTVTVLAGGTVTPAEVAVTTALDAPTIDVSGAAVVTPAAVAVTVAIDTPTITVTGLVTPAEVAVTTALPTPTIDVSGAGLVSPATVTVTVGIDTPTITVAGLVSPAVVAVTATLDNPTVVVTGGATVTPAAVEVTLAFPAPTVTAGALVIPATVAVVADLPVPTAAVATTVTPATVTVVANLDTPSYTAGGLVTVATVTVTVDVPQPGLEAEVAIDFYYEGGTTLGRHEGAPLIGAGSGGALIAAVAGLSAVLVGAAESTADLLETEVGYELPVTAGLMVWLDAAQLDLADGAAVSPWPDLSGGGRDGTIVGTPAPVVRTGALNGLPVVRFTVNEGRVRGTNGLVATDQGLYKHTLLYVTRLWGPNVGRSFAGQYPAVNFLVGFHTTGQDIMYDAGWIGTLQAWTAAPGPWKLYGSDSHHTGVDYLVRFFKDGVVMGSATIGGGIGPGYNISGYDATGTQETMDCEVAELLLYNRKLPDVERQQVESYLADKWGL